jgi:hypothetical protein
LRVEYPGAGHQALNRGNSRKDVFVADAIEEMFAETLLAACEKTLVYPKKLG